MTEVAKIEGSVNKVPTIVGLLVHCQVTFAAIAIFFAELAVIPMHPLTP